MRVSLSGCDASDSKLRGGPFAWDDCKKIPWGVLILFGGGIAIAKAFGESDSMN